MIEENNTISCSLVQQVMMHVLRLKVSMEQCQKFLNFFIFTYLFAKSKCVMYPKYEHSISTNRFHVVDYQKKVFKLRASRSSKTL